MRRFLTEIESQVHFELCAWDESFSNYISTHASTKKDLEQLICTRPSNTMNNVDLPKDIVNHRKTKKKK